MSDPVVIGNPGGPSRIRDLYRQGRSVAGDSPFASVPLFFPLLNQMRGLYAVGLSVSMGQYVRSDVTYVAISDGVHHIRDLIEHPQYEPDGRFPW